MVEIHAHFFRQFCDPRGSLHTHGEHHHIELFTDCFTRFIHIAQEQVVRRRYGIHAVNAGAHKTDPVFLGAVVILLKFLAEGPHVHVEDGGVQTIFGMLFGYHRFFDRVHTADAGTVAVVAMVDVAGAHALEPGDLLGFLLV